MSPNSVRSNWVKKEVETALLKEIKGKRGAVIPLYYRKCKFPAFLEGKCYIDFKNNMDYKAS